MFSDEECFFSGDDEGNSSGNEHAPVSSAPRTILDPEVWQDYWNEELLDLWDSLKEQCASQGMAVLDKCTFSDFADFCFRCSSGYPPAC